MEFQVWRACKDACDTYQPLDKVTQLSDPVEAIKEAAMLRDRLHETWIEIVE